MSGVCYGTSTWSASALAAKAAIKESGKQAAGHTAMATMKTVTRMEVVCKIEPESKTKSVCQLERGAVGLGFWGVCLFQEFCGVVGFAVIALRWFRFGFWVGFGWFFVGCLGSFV